MSSNRENEIDCQLPIANCELSETGAVQIGTDSIGNRHLAIGNRQSAISPHWRGRAGGPRAGFTLVEMLLVVTILGIVAAVVIPTLDSTTGQVSLESLARLVAADLRLARQAAVQYNTSYTVAFDLAANTYQIMHTGSGGPPPLVNPLSHNSNLSLVDLKVVGLNRQGQMRVILGGAVLKVSQAPVVNVTFAPLGGTGPSRTQDTEIWLTQGSGANRRAIVLSIQWLTGSVSVGDVQLFPATQVLPQF
jgi:prepilin-type N-terminal cleavage/methylation domain-containing protein